MTDTIKTQTDATTHTAHQWAPAEGRAGRDGVCSVCGEHQEDAVHTDITGGPPGKKKRKGDDSVKKQLAKLINASATLPAVPAQAVAVKEGEPQKPSSKQMLKWAIKKYGAATVEQRAKAYEVTPKRWARLAYHNEAERSAPEIVLVNPLSQDTPLSSNDIAKVGANDAVAGEVKRKLTREERRAAATKAVASAAPGIVKVLKADAEAAALDTSIAQTVVALKLSTDLLLKNALHTFIDGSVKGLMDAFVSLYMSRKTDGDSDEAAAALDACRAAFDACGLALLDVETKAKESQPIKKTSATLPPHVSSNLTDQSARDKKNQKDRERRANNKKANAKKGVS